MEKNIIGQTVEKFLGEKIQKFFVVKSSDLLDLVKNMGIYNDDDEMLKVIEHFDESKIEIKFQMNDEVFKDKVNKLKFKSNFYKKINTRKSHIVDIIKKTDTAATKIKHEKYAELINFYRQENEESVGKKTQK
jgi:hypothetical protein